MEESKLLNDIVRSEDNLNLSQFQIGAVPAWRIVRYHTRLYYINNKSGYVTGTPTSAYGKPKLKIISGFWKYIGQKHLSVFFPFNRLSCINGKYFDKFVDPVIEESNIINSNYIIVDPNNYVGNYDRVHRDHTISNEGRTISFQVLKYFYKIIAQLKYGKTIRALFSCVKSLFELPDSYISVFYSEIALYLAKFRYYHIWFNILNPSRVFVVLREGYFPQIAVCKKKGIPVAEFQHGITVDKTVSYAGGYDSRIDPDYFFVFGDFWRGPQFGMPTDKIFCIGWAYGKYLSNINSDVAKMQTNAILVISSPEISDAVLDALSVLSDAKGDYVFHIRLHPCETYNESQMLKLSKISKAIIVDNKNDSAVVLPKYENVIGENSSVVYEALSVGCKVGMLNLCNLKPAIDLPEIKDNFFIIHNVLDFENFLSGKHIEKQPRCSFYSNFDALRFNNFIEQYM